MLIDAVVRRNTRFLRAQHLHASLRSLWSQSAVAERLGVSRPSYVDLESGQRRFSVDDLLALALVYDVTPTRLLLPPLGAVSIQISTGRGPSATLAEPHADEYERWLRGEEALPGQDAAFYAAHSRERTPEETPPTDGRRQPADAGLSGSSPHAEVVDAERALAGLFRAMAADDDEALEHHQDALASALDRAAARARGEDVNVATRRNWRGTASSQDRTTRDD